MRAVSPPRAFVLSVEELFSPAMPLGSIAERRLCAGMPTAAETNIISLIKTNPAKQILPVRPVALDMVLDLVMPRFPLGEVGALESEEPLEKLKKTNIIGWV